MTSVRCVVCGRSIPGDPHYPHQPGCPRVDCDCDNPCCSECCWECVLTVGSLFSGIGGLDLGLERAGMRVVWQSEIDPYCCRVLAKHWPHVPNLGDITRIDWTEVPRVDLLCGGYPCQPFSLAGQRLGEGDPRHLWPYMLDAIRVLRPRWALLENVPGHLALGFGRVLGDLAEIGYDTEWDCIPATAVGAPHLRDRVFVVAYPDGGGHGGTEDARRVGRVDGGDEGPARERERARSLAVDRGSTADVADPTRVSGQDEPKGDRSGVPVGTESRPSGRASRRDPAEGVDVDRRGPGIVAPSVADSDGRPSVWATEPRPERHHWAVEPEVGRVAHGVPHRVDRLRALGNAVVPQVAEHIGRRIVEVAS